MSDSDINDLLKERIYHITCISNLHSILEQNGLWCPNKLRENSIHNKNAAHANINRRRWATAVPVSKNGTLADYVPFHFCRRSPQLCSIKHKNVAGVEQNDLAYLIIPIKGVLKNQSDFAFTDGLPIYKVTTFFDHITQLNMVDWDVIKAASWHRTPDDPDKTRRRNAEFLIHTFVPWALISGIAVANHTSLLKVQDILSRFKDRKNVPVKVKQEWYY